MPLKKSEKLLLLIANSIYAIYLAFVIFWISSFRAYAATDYLRVRLVNQLREQTKLTMDSANISTKDLNYIVEIMGQLAYLYVGLFIVLFLLIIYLQVTTKNIYLFSFVLLIYAIAILLFSIGILFITCIIYFYVGLVLFIKGKNRIQDQTAS